LQSRKSVFTEATYPDRFGKIVSVQERRDGGMRLVYVVVDRLGRQIIDPSLNLPFTARAEDFNRYMQAGRLSWVG